MVITPLGGFPHQSLDHSQLCDLLHLRRSPDVSRPLLTNPVDTLSSPWKEHSLNALLVDSAGIEPASKVFQLKPNYDNIEILFYQKRYRV